jgi:hypothetical protein
MRFSYLAIYNVGIAAVCAGAMGFAFKAEQRAHAHGTVTNHAAQLQKQADTAAAADQLAVDRYNALTARFAQLTKQINANQKALAAEITRTRTIKRKVVTGSTVVSYVTVSGGSSSG